jgi:hypothetical protein
VRLGGVPNAPDVEGAMSRFACGCCGRRLPAERYVYSRWTGSRYCWPGECRKRKGGRKAPNPGQLKGVKAKTEVVGSTRNR